MAPGFLSKLVTHSRASSEVDSVAPQSRSPSGTAAARRRLPSIGAPSITNGGNAKGSRTPSLKIQPPDNNGRETPTSDSSNPNVTVIPPSPGSGSNFPGTSDTERQGDDRPRSTEPSTSRPSTAHSLQDDNPTPTAASMSRQRAQSTPTADMMKPSLSQQSHELRKQTSDRSLNGSQSASQSTSFDSPEEIAYNNGMTPITESPTEMKYPIFQPVPERTSSLFVPQKDADTASIRSAADTFDKKKKVWRRGSASSRKPTGLASALAASGLAMVNPAMQMPLPAQLSPQRPPRTASIKPQSRKSSIGSPSRAGRTSLDRRSTRSSDKSPSSHQRKRSLVHSNDGHSDTYGEDPANYSALEDSDEESESESDDYLSDDLAAHDIPVTGFAVASNKRNADFHEIFPNIPEGDYLIEDYGCALQREILIQGRIYISENHICFHANIFGWITDLSIPIYEITNLEKKMTAFVIPNAIQITSRQAKYTFASFLARDTTFDVIYNIWKLSKPHDSTGFEDSQRPSLEGNPSDLRVTPEGRSPLAPKITQCACGKSGDHFSETAMDIVIPGTPDRIYNLIFASGFIKDFMRDDQKLLDIQISDWSPVSPDSNLLARNMSYIKPLNGSVGPKQTKCEIRDETVHCDFDDYVVTLTTTRTPDVPSGSVFSVKTRTCIMWASAISTKVIVTTQVEWTGRSFIKGIIERSCIEGQKTYHTELERAMRSYILEHQSEFMPAGVDLEEVAPVTALSVDETAVTAKENDAPSDKKRERERNLRSLQWAWDTFEGASSVARQSTRGALELLKDAWDQSSSTTILIFVIVFLVLSNLYTMLKMGSREEVGRRKELKKLEEREKWIHGVVAALWDELAVNGNTRGAAPPSSTPAVVAEVSGSELVQDEIIRLHDALNTIEQRIHTIRESLVSLDINTVD